MTLASDQTTAPSANREGIPPTLLRLPDLDPPAADTSADVPAESIAGEIKESAVPTESQIHAAVGDPISSTQSPRPAMRSHVEAAVSAAATAPDVSAESDSEPAVKSVVEPVRRTEATPPREPVNHDPATWLTVLASRKTLLVLLALIAAMAIFLPRGENASSEHETPMLVENGVPPQTNLAAPTTDLSESLNAPVTAGAQLRQPIASHAPRSTHQDVSEPVASRPPTSPKSQFASGTPFATTMPSEPPSFEPVDPFDMTIASPTDGTSKNRLFPTVAENRDDARSFSADDLIENDPMSVIDTTFDVTTPERTSVASQPMDAASPARLVESRTPHAITDWKKFLPGMTVDQSPDPADASQSTVIRTSTAPAEPNFEFALPGEPTTAGTGGVKSTAIAPTPDVAGSAPEARVAMPPMPSTPSLR